MAIKEKLRNYKAIRKIKSLIVDDHKAKTQKQVWEHWENQDQKDFNYYETMDDRVAYLKNLFREGNLPKNSKVLEIGCNVGRNLKILWNEGYKVLSGIEINKKAVKRMRQIYPESKNWEIYAERAEIAIKKAIKGVDVVLTVAALQHIKDIETIKKTIDHVPVIVTIENEETSNSVHFRRNYAKEFPKHKCIKKFKHDFKHGFSAEYVTRVLRRET